MTTILSTRTAPWAICHRSCFGKEDRQIKTAGGTGIRGQDQLSFQPRQEFSRLKTNHSKSYRFCKELYRFSLYGLPKRKQSTKLILNLQRTCSRAATTLQCTILTANSAVSLASIKLTITEKIISIHFTIAY